MKKDYVLKNKELISKLILLLYSIVPLSPFIMSIEYEAFQWLYFSVLNIFTLIYLHIHVKYFNTYKLSKNSVHFFGICLLFFLLSCLSMIKSIFIIESLVHLSRLVNIFIGVFCLLTIVKKEPKVFFLFISKVVTLLLLFFNYRTLNFIINNFSKARTISLYENFLSIYKFGNINIYTAWTIISLPFSFYLFFYSKKTWKYLGLSSIVTTYIALIFSGSRTALLSLSILTITFLIYNIVNYIKNKEKNFLTRFLTMLIIPVVSLFFVINANRLYKNEMNPISSITKFQSKNYKTVERILKNNKEITNVNITSLLEEESFFIKLIKKTGNGRYEIWRSATNMFLDNPILGVGYGNYQVYTKGDFFKRKRGKQYNVPRRVHNDFIEKFVETGLLGGFTYVLLFLFLIQKLYQIYKKKQKEETKIALFLVLILTVYVLDAFFNFPLERAVMQLYFILTSVFILALDYKDNKEEKSVKKLPFFIIITGVLLFTVWSNYKTFVAYKNIFLINTDIKNKPLFSNTKYLNSYDNITKKLGDYPVKAGERGWVNSYLALHAVNEGRYEEGLKITNRYINKNIDQYNLQKLKAHIFLEGLKNIDSAEFYAKKVFKEYPSYSHNYELLKKVYLQKKDTLSYVQLMRKYVNHNYTDIDEWLRYANLRNKKGKNLEMAVKVLDSALAYNKNEINGKFKLIKAKNKLLAHKKVNEHIENKEVKEYYEKIVNLYKKQKFIKCKKILFKLLKIEPKDHFATLYVGIVEMQLKNYREAIGYLTKSINKGVFKDGKAEFCRGYCYEQINDMIKAKRDYTISREKKFPQALKLEKSKYN